ncbi:MAG: hypothetical protein NC548_20565 [Lachnospiraceae bacterium]|nr:hypothetical protein [Lachnospiraceae bacterium]
MKEKQGRLAISIQDIALIGMMTAVIEVSKLALSFLPNIELVTFWIIMFTLFLGPKTVYAILAFILIEISVYGIHTWVIMYLYMWPLLSLIVYLCRKNDSAWFYGILSGFFGLFFGAFCSLPYIVIGAVDGGIRSGIVMAFNWWVAGIPYDILHGIANTTLMLVLYRPVRSLLKRLILLHHST